MMWRSVTTMVSGDSAREEMTAATDACVLRTGDIDGLATQAHFGGFGEGANDEDEGVSRICLSISCL